MTDRPTCLECGAAQGEHHTDECSIGAEQSTPDAQPQETDEKGRPMTYWGGLADAQPTPRTDAHLGTFSGSGRYEDDTEGEWRPAADASFARQLERELTQSQADLTAEREYMDALNRRVVMQTDELAQALADLVAANARADMECENVNQQIIRHQRIYADMNHRIEAERTARGEAENELVSAQSSWITEKERAEAAEARLAPEPEPVAQPTPRFQNWCLASHGHDLVASPNGNWVRYSDYERALAQCQADLAAANERRIAADVRADLQRRIVIGLRADLAAANERITWCPHMTDGSGHSMTCGEYIASERTAREAAEHTVAILNDAHKEASDAYERTVMRAGRAEQRAETAEARLAPEPEPVAQPEPVSWIAGRQRTICVNDLRNLAKHAKSDIAREAHEYAADMISKSTLYAARRKS